MSDDQVHPVRTPLMTRIGFLPVWACALIAVSATAADDNKKTRVGTCKDAKSQMEYFCNPANAAKDSMVGFGTACTNAKSNVKEACEGIVEPDKKYEFDDKKVEKKKEEKKEDEKKEDKKS